MKTTQKPTAATSYQEKSILAVIKPGKESHVKVKFKGDFFTPEEFTSIFMAILEDYTMSLLQTNSKEAVFEHFNNVFGIFLNKLVPEDEHYSLSKSHKKFKKVVDSTLSQENTPEVQKSTEDNRFAAYLLCRDILTHEIGLTDEAAYTLLRKRLFLNTPVSEKLKGTENAEK